MSSQHTCVHNKFGLEDAEQGYERGAGHEPFKGESILQLYDHIQKAPLRLPRRPAVSDRLKDLLTRLLDKNPATRLGLPGLLTHPALVRGALRSLPSASVRAFARSQQACWF